jgi:uncharacterized protein (DUF433 family)
VELENYFEFLADDAIRIVGTRVGIETVIGDYQEGANPEEIALRYPTLTLEQIHATITYYLAHPDRVGAYVLRVRQQQEAAYQQAQQHPSALLHSLRERVARLRQERRSETPVWPAKSCAGEIGVGLGFSGSLLMRGFKVF